MLTAVRVCRVLLVVWTVAAPLLWIPRDGLGPDAVDSTGTQAAGKVLFEWGVPAVLIAVPLFGLSAVERRPIRKTERLEETEAER